MATLSDQARKIMESNPLCMARHCGLPADEIITIAGKLVPYCKDHAWFWKAQEKDRAIYNQFMEEAKADERKISPQNGKVL
jgi:hypothetical protein